MHIYIYVCIRINMSGRSQRIKLQNSSYNCTDHGSRTASCVHSEGDDLDGYHETPLVG